MRFNEEVEEGSKKDFNNDQITRDDSGIEVTTVEEIAEETAIFLEAVEGPSRSAADTDFSGDPTAPGGPAFPTPPTTEPPQIDLPNPDDYENPFGDIGDQIDLGNIDFTDTVGLLQAQLQMMNIMSDLMVRMASQQQSILTVNQDVQQVSRANFEVNRRILQNAKPFQLVTVSGINEVENANNPEPVVPNSDETQIPTRELMIKSSRSNSEKIWFGDDETTPNSGFSLSPGEGTSVEIDLREQQLYMASTEAAQVVELLGVV